MTQSPLTPAQPHASPSLTGDGGARVAPPEPRVEVPLQETLVDLWENVQKLVRQELALAKTELAEKAQRLKTEMVGSAAGAALVHAGLLALVAGIVLLLSRVMPDWAAAALTGAVAAGGGYLLLNKQRPTAADIKPERTLRNLQKDVQTFTEARR